MTRSRELSRPHLCITEDEVSLEWWCEHRHLAVFIEPGRKVTAIKSWGPNIHTEMEEATLTKPQDLHDALDWLENG